MNYLKRANPAALAACLFLHQLMLSPVLACALQQPPVPPPADGEVSQFDEDLTGSNAGEHVELADGIADADGSAWTVSDIWIDQDPGPGAESDPTQEGTDAERYDGESLREDQWGCKGEAVADAFATPQRAVVDAHTALRVFNNKDLELSAGPIAVAAYAGKAYIRDPTIPGAWVGGGVVSLPFGKAAIQGFHSHWLKGYVQTELDLHGVVRSLDGPLSLERDEEESAAEESEAMSWGVESLVGKAKGYAKLARFALVAQIASDVWSEVSEAYSTQNPIDVTVEREEVTTTLYNEGTDYTVRVAYGTTASVEARCESSGPWWEGAYVPQNGVSRISLVAFNQSMVVLDSWTHALPQDPAERIPQLYFALDYTIPTVDALIAAVLNFVHRGNGFGAGLKIKDALSIWMIIWLALID